jgi:hypothetical protein
MRTAACEVETRKFRPRSRPLERSHPAVRAAAVQRSPGSWEHAVEVRRRRDLRQLGVHPNLEVASLQRREGSLGAFVDLRCFELVPVADGGCIGEYEEALGPFRRDGAAVAVLGADIDSRLPRHLATAEETLELVAVVVREEDGVTEQGKASRRGDTAPSHCRQRARLFGRARYRP